MQRNIFSIRFSILLVGLLALTITPSRSQVRIQLGGGLGVAIPVSDFSGSTAEYYSGTRYGMGSGLNLNGKGKIGWSGWSMAGEIDYSSVHNNGNSEPGQGTVDISQNVLSLKAGPEFQIGVPALPVFSYIGVNLSMNRFSGETTFKGVSKVPSATYSVQAATRFGVGVSAGTEISMGPFVALDFNVSYNMMNVFGKAWDDRNPGIEQRIDSYVSLNDVRDPQYASSDDTHFVSNDRNIHSILFTASILFGL